MGMELLFRYQWSVVGCQNENGQSQWFRVSGNNHLTERGCGLTMVGEVAHDPLTMLKARSAWSTAVFPRIISVASLNWSSAEREIDPWAADNF
jgi:hypothetical protein